MGMISRIVGKERKGEHVGLGEGLERMVVEQMENEKMGRE